MSWHLKVLEMTSMARAPIMNFELKNLSWAACAQAPCDALILLVPNSSRPDDKAKTKKAKPQASSHPALQQLMLDALSQADLDTATGKLISSYRPSGIAARQVILVGAGQGSDKDVARACAAAFSACKFPSSVKSAHVLLCLAELGSVTGDALQAAMQAAASSSYVYTHTKSKPEERKLSKVTINLASAAQVKGLEADHKAAQALIEGVELAKEWGNRPANYATPTLLAKAAQGIAAGKSPVSCEVLGPKEVAKLKMGSFMAVAQGSEQPLRFIVLKYFGAAKTVPPTVLVGKGITFDTGGISIKPAAEMDEMKFDMCGAASVLGVFKTLSVQRPKINVIGLIPSCENMPSHNAVKPGDVVTSMSGQTIEILNTDAEGRLILCDALTYAERFKPAAVVDIATLTGACVVALGGVRSGLFSVDDHLAADLLQAGEASQDLAWRMPLDEEYAEGLKTNFADVANVAGRMGGAITAAKFLQRFATQYRWAHLDIAGTAWKSGAAKGATGRPVPLLMKFLLNLEKKPLLARTQSAQSAI
jgi:leucyl aminopeptidase